RHTRSYGDWSSDVCSSDLVRRGAALRDRDEQRVVETLVVAAERVAGMDPLRPRGLNGRLRVPSDPHGKLLERCPSRKHELEARVHETLLRVLAEGHAGLPQFPHTLRPEPRE